jgi:signal transduction histidine kinase
MPEALPLLSNPIRTSFYRTLQEALTNVQKHAHASQVQVNLDYSQQQLCLTVRDNGVGITADGKGGFGLKGLKERAVLLGGQFEVGSPAAGGTVVTFSVALPGEDGHA